MIDLLQELSLARTALDDPGALDVDSPIAYAIDRIDDVMSALNPEEDPGETLRTIAAFLREEVTGPSGPDDDDPLNVVKLVQSAAGLLGVAALRLRGES